MAKNIAYHIMLHVEEHDLEIDLNNLVLLNHISELLKEHCCPLYAIGTRGKRLNMLISLNPKLALDTLVKEIMISSETLIHENILIRGFQNWERDYWAYTHSVHAMDHIIDYIMAEQKTQIRQEESYYRRKKKEMQLEDDPFPNPFNYLDP